VRRANPTTRGKGFSLPAVLHHGGETPAASRTDPREKNYTPAKKEEGTFSQRRADLPKKPFAPWENRKEGGRATGERKDKKKRSKGKTVSIPRQKGGRPREKTRRGPSPREKEKKKSIQKGGRLLGAKEREATRTKQLREGEISFAHAMKKKKRRGGGEVYPAEKKINS